MHLKSKTNYTHVRASTAFLVYANANSSRARFTIRRESVIYSGGDARCASGILRDHPPIISFALVPDTALGAVHKYAVGMRIIYAYTDIPGSVLYTGGGGQTRAGCT